MSYPKLDLNEASREVAKAELGENPATKVQQLQALREWVIKQNYLECRTDDEFLLRFLRVSKFSCEAAKERLEKYCVARTSKLDGMPEWFCDQDVDNEEYREILEKGIIYPLSEPDEQGRLIMFTNYGAAADYEPMKCGRAAFMMFDYVMAKYPRAQIHGIRMLENAAGYNREQMKYWNLERVPKAIGIMQGSMPLRIKNIDWYNIPVFGKVVMEAGMLVMKSKIRERMKIHSKYDTPNGIPSHIVPPVMSGGGPQWDEIKDELLKDLASYRSEFDSLKMCKVFEEKRPKQVYQGDTWGISGTYISTGTD